MNPDESVPAPILSQATSGYRTTLLTQAVRVCCKIVGVVALSRLVSPAEHGMFAMAASLTLLLSLFRDFGMSTAAIQARELSEGQLTALLWLHVGLGVVLAALTLLLVPLVSAFYGEPRIGPLLAVMSVSFLLIGANAWPRTQLGRELRFSELNRVETLGAITGTLVMIASGALGAGAYAFAGFLIVSEAAMLVEAWRLHRWRPRTPAHWRSLRELWRTGLHFTGYNLLLYVLQQADTLLMGRWFGATPLGLYNRAGQLLVLPATHLAMPFSQVLLATLSRLGPDSRDFTHHFRDTINAIAHFTLPIAVLCLVLPDEVVRFVLGTNWTAAAPLLRWLAISAFTSYLTATVYVLCIATGQPARLTQLMALVLPVTLLGLWLGRNHGPVGLAAGLAGANCFLLVPRLWWAARGTPVRLHDYAEAFAGPIGVAVVFAGGLFGGRILFSEMETTGRLFAAGVCGTVALTLCSALWPRAQREFSRLWQHRPWSSN